MPHEALIEATRYVGPPIFWGVAGATTASIIAFWVVFYLWLGGELWLGRSRRAPAGATRRDDGSKWLLISSVWLTVALGIGLALRFPMPRLQVAAVCGSLRAWS